MKTQRSCYFLRNILKGFSLTSALFIFEACYGTPKGIWIEDYDVRLKVVSADDLSPIEGIAVKTRLYEDESLDWTLAGYTDKNGTAEVFVGNIGGNSPQFRFESEDGTFMVKDTVISNPDVLINIKLQKNR